MSNTYSSNLVTEHLLEGADTTLQNHFAPLKALARTWEPDPLKPKAKCEAKLVTVGATTQKNATNFESGDSTVTAIPIIVDQYTQSFQVSNADLNSGLRLEDLVTANIKTFCNQIVDVALAPATSANFANPLVRGSGTFSWADMSTLWGLLKKSDTKNAILDGEYMGKLINQPGFFQKTGTGPGAGYETFGWDFLGLNTRWNGAEANVVGLVCNPQCIGAVCGLPLKAPGSNTLEQRILELPDLDIKVAYHVWFSLATRTLWASFDLMFGAAVGDTTAAILIKSA